MTLPPATPEPQQPHRNTRTLRRRHVPVPESTPTADALFFVLRSMRTPLIIVVLVFAIAVAGLTQIPGQDNDGNTYYMSVFDSFYFFSYTATTIGFGETPYNLVREQRLWVTVCIYASVIAWAYLLGAVLGLVRESAFRDALARQSFARKVRGLRRPFLILVGYGQMGRAAAETLDMLGRSLVVVANDQESIDALAGAVLSNDIPGLVGDARDPGVLGLAGLGSKHCAGVLTLTDDDPVNLSIVMAVTLLRPDLPVIARTNSRETAKAMREFGADGVVNPFERYGNYLVMRLRRPSTYRIITWLMAPPGEPLSPEVGQYRDGSWVIVSDDHFGAEIAQDLDDAGLDSTRVSPIDGAPDVAGAVGFIAGGSDDATNLALAGHARLQNPDLFLTVRQRSKTNGPLLHAFAPDSIFVPAQITVQEALARVITPDFWKFVQYLWNLEEEESAALLSRIVKTVGRASPDSRRFVLNQHEAPAALRWAAKHPLRLGDLFRHPDDRDNTVEALPVTLIRAGKPTFMPDLDEHLRPDDVVIAVGRPKAFDTMSDALFYDHTIEYLATGEEVPSTWLWRALKRR